jgi:hypothetical protein
MWGQSRNWTSKSKAFLAGARESKLFMREPKLVKTLKTALNNFAEPSNYLISFKQMIEYLVMIA